jgi:hypothetical protein
MSSPFSESITQSQILVAKSWCDNLNPGAADADLHSKICQALNAGAMTTLMQTCDGLSPQALLSNPDLHQACSVTLPFKACLDQAMSTMDTTSTDAELTKAKTFSIHMACGDAGLLNELKLLRAVDQSSSAAPVPDLAPDNEPQEGGVGGGDGGDGGDGVGGVGGSDGGVGGGDGGDRVGGVGGGDGGVGGGGIESAEQEAMFRNRMATMDRWCNVQLREGSLAPESVKQMCTLFQSTNGSDRISEICAMLDVTSPEPGAERIRDICALNNAVTQYGLCVAGGKSAAECSREFLVVSS